MTSLVQQLLNQAEEIVLLEKKPAENKYRFAFPFKGDFARECYDSTLKLDNNLPEFQQYWKFKEQTEQINGSSIFLLTRLNRILKQEGLELPDTCDLLELNGQDKLSLGKIIDCGVVVYSDSSLNQETAKILIEKAKQERWELPLLWGFKDLDYIVSDNHAKIISVAQPKRVILGRQAKEILNKFFKRDSGACRVCHDRFAGWSAYLDGFAFSNSYGLVGWLVAEGDRENLEEGYDNLLTRKYDEKTKDLQELIIHLNEKRDLEKKAFLESLKA